MHDVDPTINLGHAQWESATAPAGEADVEKKAFWRCVKCAHVVGFWLDDYGSSPTSTTTEPPANVGIYAGEYCT